MANAETKARAAKNAAADASAKIADAGKEALNEFTNTAFAYPRFEMPDAVRSFAEQGLNQTRDAYLRMKSAAEEATDLMEGSLETTRTAVRDAQFKALDAAKANADATFDFFRQMLTVTSVADAVQLQSAFARDRVEAFVGYSKDMQAFVTKAGTEAAKPAQTMFEKVVATAKAA
jgi:phasin